MQSETQQQNNLDNPKTVAQRGLNSQSANREVIALAGTPVRIDLTGRNVLFIEVTVTGEAVGTAELEAVAGFVLDAPSAGVAAIWLTPANHLIDDSELYQVKKGESYEESFVYPLSYLDIVRLVGSETLHVTIITEDVD